MDSITQVMLGATVAEAGFRKKLGGRAVAWGAFCGLAPDLDILATVGNEWNELLYHRGLSHSLIVLTAAAPLIGALAWRWPGKKQGRVVDWIHLTFWALITHPLLDACTAYGTQLLAPLTDRRFAIDAVAIVDPVYSLPLLAAILVGWRAKDVVKSTRFAAIVLALTTAYLGLGFVQSQRAIAWAERELRESGFESTEIRALPTLANIFVWRVVARDDRGHFRATTASLTAPRPLHWHTIDDDDDPLVERAKELPRAQLFQWFAMGFAQADLIHEDEGFTVRLSDLRYGSTLDPSRAMWGADVHFGSDGEFLSIERWNEARERDNRKELRAFWAHLVGDDEALRALSE